MANDETINQCSVVLTRNCNLRCDFCYAKGAGYCANEMVSLDDLKSIVDFCCDAQVKYIFFTGGEPLLYPYLIDILDYIKQQQRIMQTAVATNGVVLEDISLCQKLVESGLDYVDISMKGVDAKEWVDVTGVDGYSKQQIAIKNLASLNFDFTCSMVVTLENIASLCDSVKNAIEAGAKQVSFTFVIDNNNRESSHGIKYLEDNNPFELVESFIAQIDELNTITTEWWIEYSFPLCLFTDRQMETLKGKMASPCQIHKRNAVTFDTQLYLLPCDMYFNNRIGRLGNEFRDAKGYFDFSKDSTYKKTIDEISCLPSKRCLDCKCLDRCYGGCPVLWRNYSFDEMMEFKEKHYGEP